MVVMLSDVTLTEEGVQCSVVVRLSDVTLTEGANSAVWL